MVEIGSKANKRKREPDSFEQQLQRQLGFLKRSCDAFDKGDHDEAVRIATTIRVLLHDTPASTSLLTHLGIKSLLFFVDTGIYRERLEAAMKDWLGEYHPGSIISGHTPSDVGLVELGIGKDGKVGWFAPLRLRRKPENDPAAKAIVADQSFDAWWKTPLVETSTFRTFSRAHLIQIMANQDGGAHVDAELDTDYEDLKIDFLGIQMEVGEDLADKTMGGDLPPVVNNVAFASVRQIAFELMLTINRFYAYRDQPGLYAFAEPYAYIVEEELPHMPFSWPQPILLGSGEA